MLRAFLMPPPQIMGKKKPGHDAGLPLIAICYFLAYLR